MHFFPASSRVSGFFVTKSIPYLFGGICFLSDTLLSTCQDVEAFMEMATFSGLLFGTLSSILHSFSFPLGAVSFTVVFDEMSIMEGGAPSSKSMATSWVFAFPRFFTFPFLAAGCSDSLELGVSSTLALLPVFLSVYFCSVDAHTMSRFEKTFGRFAFSGSTAIVCCVSCTTSPVFLAKAASSLETSILSRISIVESVSS